MKFYRKLELEEVIAPTDVSVQVQGANGPYTRYFREIPFDSIGWHNPNNLKYSDIPTDYRLVTKREFFDQVALEALRWSEETKTFVSCGIRKTYVNSPWTTYITKSSHPVYPSEHDLYLKS